MKLNIAKHQTQMCTYNTLSYLTGEDLPEYSSSASLANTFISAVVTSNNISVRVRRTLVICKHA